MSGWLTPFDGYGIDWHTSLPSPYTYQESDFSKLIAAVHEYESRCRDLKAALDRRDAALVEIIDQSKDEPGGLNFANRAFEIAREALGWETERRFDRLPMPEDGYTGWKS